MLLFRNLNYILFTLFFVAATAQFSHAAANITVEQSGVINGNGMDGVAGIELTINYDTSLLSSPTVTKGRLVATGMMAANTSLPGVIRIAIISTAPFSGSGQIADIKFASNSGDGGIKSIPSSSIIDSKGNKMALQTSLGAATSTTGPTELITNPGVPFSSTASSPTTTTSTTTATQTTPTSTSTSTTTSTSTSTAAATTMTSVPGYINFGSPQPDTPQPKAESHIPDAANYQTSENMPQQQAEPDISTESQTSPNNKPPLEEKPEGSSQSVIYKGIIDRFKTYRGDKSLPIVAALFHKEISKFIRQEPSVALSDGKSRIKTIVDLPTHIATSPNFALNYATLLSVKKEAGKDRRWIIESLPDNNSWKSTLIIIAGNESFEYPLTVAPTVSRLKLDEAGWDAFLKGNGKEELPMNDLNQDGRHDHIDEYIFVANYLAAKQVKSSPSK